MTHDPINKVLARLAELVRNGQFDQVETDTLEIKPVPHDSQSWKEIHESVCSLLNTRGGLILVGIKESQVNGQNAYYFSGWQSQAEPKIKEIPSLFKDRKGHAVPDLAEYINSPRIVDFPGGQLAILSVSELPADRKFIFYEGQAYKRILTGDHKIPQTEIERQDEYQEESLQSRELRVVEGTSIQDLDLDRLNDYITRLNAPRRIETLKPDLGSALSFLERKCFIKNGVPTALGLRVCGTFPADHLGFRCHVHGYVDVPQLIAQDKQDLIDNILPLMESSLAHVLRNIHVGVSVEHGGTSRPQYPEELLRETVKNALAHRDYTLNRQAILAICPGQHISISNPGRVRKQLLLENPSSETPLYRILPEAKPRNPKLADVLRVFRKWEGRGIGMATLVDLCLQNEIGLPYYILKQEDVTLYLQAGQLLDDGMERHIQSFDGYIAEKMNGQALTVPQKLVLAYLIKSEQADQRVRYTILLTPDNNHFNEVHALEAAGLILKDSASTPTQPIYLADRLLMRTSFVPELRVLFGLGFDSLSESLKDIWGVVYRFNRFSRERLVNAKSLVSRCGTCRGKEMIFVPSMPSIARFASHSTRCPKRAISSNRRDLMDTFWGKTQVSSPPPTRDRKIQPPLCDSLSNPRRLPGEARMKWIRIAALICLGLSGQAAYAENWAEWRGPQHNGISTETGIATSWAKDKNVAWSVKLPGQGGATPVVWEDRIYLTSSEGDDLVVMGISTAGKELWKTKVGTGNKDARAGEGNSASPSPVTDGKHIWVCFGTGELACLDRDGKIVWHFNVEERYGQIDIQFGMTSTPLLHDGALYLQLIHGTMQTDYTVGKIVRLVAETGQEVWAVDRKQNPKDECKHAYSSPIIMPGKNPHLISHGGDCTVGHSLEDGHELWRLDELNGPSQYNKNHDTTLRFVASPTATEEFVVVPTAKGGPVLGLQASELSGDITGKSPVRWVGERTPDVSCPIIHEGLVYLCMNDGRLLCVEQATGQGVYEKRIYNAQYRASGVVSEGHLYLTARDGVCTVVKLGREFEVLSENEFGEPQTASPAISNGTLYMRTYDALYAIREK